MVVCPLCCVLLCSQRVEREERRDGREGSYSVTYIPQFFFSQIRERERRDVCV